MITELSKLPEEVWRGRDMVPALMATNATEHFSSSFRTAKGSCLLFDRCSAHGLFLSIDEFSDLHFQNFLAPETNSSIIQEHYSTQLPLQTGTVTGALPAKRN